MTTSVTSTRSYATAITELQRGRPEHDTPPADRGAWMQRKVELLAGHRSRGGDSYSALIYEFPRMLWAVQNVRAAARSTLRLLAYTPVMASSRLTSSLLLTQRRSTVEPLASIADWRS